MRNTIAGLGLVAFLLFLSGCNHWFQNTDNRSVQGGISNGRTPSSAELVKDLNLNARQIQSFQCKVSIEARGSEGAASLEGRLACDKPRNLRMKASMLGNPAVDIGSNNQEFWFWTSQSEGQYVYHCAYNDLRPVQAQVPFQPDWIMEALGMCELDETKERKVNPKGNTFELVEQTVSPVGQQLQKVTVFSRDRAVPGKPQVLAHILQDANGKEICSVVHFRSEASRSGRQCTDPDSVGLVGRKAGRQDRAEAGRQDRVEHATRQHPGGADQSDTG